MKININEKDRVLIEKFELIRQKGFYVDSKQLTDVYNRVLNKRVNPTNCSQCAIKRIQELVDALNSFKSGMKMSGFTNSDYFIDEINAIEADFKPSESVSENKVNNDKEKENNELTKAESMKEKMAKVRSHRKNKK